MDAKNSYNLRGFSLVAAAAGFLGMVTLLYFIYQSGARTLSQLEVTLFTVLIMILETSFGVYTGTWTARDSARREYQPFVRSALRRTYGLAEGLERVQDSAREGIRRMSTRTQIEPKGQAQLWGEILNVLHSQMNELLRQAEASIEDWREIGREEIERLEQSQREKQEKISQITQRLGELYELMSDLSAAPTATESAIERLETAADSLEQELHRVRGQSVISTTATDTVQRGEARKLLLMGAFEEAIETYARMIQVSPNDPTLFVGRARSRFLSGDTKGALSDLDRAESLAPSDPTVKRARELIISGELFPASGSRWNSPNIETATEGHQALARGQINEAQRLYKEAEDLGLSPTFVSIDQTMLELLKKNPKKAREALSRINISLARRPMKVQYEALVALCGVMEEANLDLTLPQYAREQCPTFQLSKSPLRYLETGLAQKQILSSDMKHIFDIIS